jgi:hypothetical protein
MNLTEIRHDIVEKHILLETFLNNLFANYFCDSEETSSKLLFIILQNETSFKKKIEWLNNLKLYELEYIKINSSDHKKGIKSLEWINRTRNEIVHNCCFLNENKKIRFNVIKSGKVKSLEINKGFMNDLDKYFNEANNFLITLLIAITHEKKLIKDFNKHFKKV